MPSPVDQSTISLSAAAKCLQWALGIAAAVVLYLLQSAITSARVEVEAVKSDCKTTAAKVQALEIEAGRTDEKFKAIQAALDRIEKKIGTAPP